MPLYYLTANKRILTNTENNKISEEAISSKDPIGLEVQLIRDMKIHPGYESGTDSNLSISSSDEQLKIDTSYFSEKSCSCESNIENYPISKLDVASTNNLLICSELNLENSTDFNLELSESTIDSEPVVELESFKNNTSFESVSKNVSPSKKDRNLEDSESVVEHESLLKNNISFESISSNVSFSTPKKDKDLGDSIPTEELLKNNISFESISTISFLTPEKDGNLGDSKPAEELERLLKNNISFESITSNASFSTPKKDKNLRGKVNLGLLQQSFDSLENNYFLNNSDSNLKINSVYSLSFLDNSTLQTFSSISPFKINSDYTNIIQSVSEKVIVDPHSETENTPSKLSNNFVSLEKELTNFRNSSVLKEKLDNSLDRPLSKSPVRNSIMNIDQTPPLKVNSGLKLRPKLRSLFFSKRKLPQLECSFSKKAQTVPETQNKILIDFEAGRPLEVLELQTKSLSELEECSELKRRNISEFKDISSPQRYFTSSTESGVDNQSDNLAVLHTSNNLLSTLETNTEVETEFDRLLVETSLSADESLLKTGKIPDVETDGNNRSSEESCGLNKSVTDMVSTIPVSEKCVQQLLEMRPKSADNKVALRQSEIHLPPSLNEDSLKEFLSSDSDNEIDAISMTENIIRFFSTQNKEEVTEMLNATKSGPIKMTLRSRSSKRPIKNKGKSLYSSLINTQKKRKPHAKCNTSPRTHHSSSVGIERNRSQSVKRKKNIKKKYESKIFPCDSCDTKFSSWQRRIKHWQLTKHKTSELCNWCNNYFFFLQKHIVNDHPAMCENCGKIFLHPEDKIKHCVEHVNKTIYCCNECHFSAFKEEEFKNHMEIHLGKQLHICEFCEMDFVDNGLLIQHLTSYHFECHICNFQCFHYQHFEEHLVKHEKKSPFTCSQCDKVFSNFKTLRYHYLGKHKNIRPHKCSICNMSFALKSRLQNHVMTHEGKYYICNTCGIHFLEERYLILHEKDHDEFICNYCKIVYKLKFNIINHLRGSSGDGFMCQKCNLDCNCRTLYDNHMKMHEDKGENTTSCQFCGIEMKNNEYLKRHMTVNHPKEYAKINKDSKICKYCLHICSSRHHLSKHIRLKHPDKRKSKKNRRVRDINYPYMCNICSMTFMYVSGYNRHLQSKKHSIVFESQKSTDFK